MSSSPIKSQISTVWNSIYGSQLLSRLSREAKKKVKIGHKEQRCLHKLEWVVVRSHWAKSWVFLPASWASLQPSQRKHLSRNSPQLLPLAAWLQVFPGTCPLLSGASRKCIERWWNSPESLCGFRRRSPLDQSTSILDSRGWVTEEISGVS